MTAPRFADLRNGGNMRPPRKGRIRATLVLASLPVLFWNLPDIMREIGRLIYG